MAPKNKDDADKNKRKVCDRSSTSSNDASFEQAQPLQKKASVSKQCPESDKQVIKPQTKASSSNTNKQNIEPNSAILKQLASMNQNILDMTQSIKQMVTKAEFEEKFEKNCHKNRFRKGH